MRLKLQQENEKHQKEIEAQAARLQEEREA
jgi:hypothetical protein